MHYYQFNIGDYISHTHHLTPMENLAYRLLLDLYYLHERPFNVCSTTLARQINLRECAQEVDTILNEFFTKTDDGWINKRADKEIAHYRVKLEQTARAGKASAAKRTINARSTDVQPTNNQQPITNNHKPILKPKGKTAPATPLPDWLQPTAWDDFKAHRKASKSAMTPRAEALAIIELTKLRAEGHDPTEVINQSISRGWKGLFAINGNGQNKEKGYYEKRAEHTAILTGQHRRKHADDPGVIHGTAERVD